MDPDVDIDEKLDTRRGFIKLLLLLPDAISGLGRPDTVCIREYDKLRGTGLRWVE